MNRDAFFKPQAVVLFGAVSLVALVAIVTANVEQLSPMFLTQSADVESQFAMSPHQDVTDVSSAITEEESDWRTDPVCKAIFEAVLEGLHRDKVSDEIVAIVIGKKSKKKDSKTIEERMKISFVLDCPLCDPTFEAFLAYQMRDKSRKVKTEVVSGTQSSEGIKDSLQADLLSKFSKERFNAIAGVTSAWISEKLNSKHQLKPEEIQAWKERIRKRASEGKDKLMALKMTDEHYKFWEIYWGCAACNGAESALMDWEG